MSKLCLLLLLVTVLMAAAGCSTPSGSREYIPGRGWVPNDWAVGPCTGVRAHFCRGRSAAKRSWQLV